MVFKINIGTKSGKTFKFDLESESIVGKELDQKIKGEELKSDLAGYEFLLIGASDKAGFPSSKEIEGVSLKKVLLTYGKGMKKRPKKEGKKEYSNKNPKGLRLRKTMRGKVISTAITQLNLKVLKEGSKKLEDIFPEQVKKPEAPKTEEKPSEQPAQ